MDSNNFKLNIFSNASFFTRIYFDDIYLGSATSFCYLYLGLKFLITNYHVVTGKNAFTNELLDKKHGAIPNRLVIEYYNRSNNLMTFEIPICENSFLNLSYKNNGKICHYDIVAIKIDDELDILPINGFDYYPKDLLIGVTDSVFVLGFPKSIHVSNTPIWKLASIASEPSIDVNNLPIFYIDTATKEGMSGSPVIIYSNKGNYRSVNGDVVLSNNIIFNFLGIYSGRDLCQNEEEARLGVVWSEKSIIDTINLYFSYTINYSD